MKRGSVMTAEERRIRGIRKEGFVRATRKIEERPQTWRAEVASAEHLRRAESIGAKVLEGMSRGAVADAMAQVLVSPRPMSDEDIPPYKPFVMTPDSAADREPIERLRDELRVLEASTTDPSEVDDVFRRLVDMELAWRRKWMPEDFDQ